MAILPVRNGNRARTHAADQLDDAAYVIGGIPDRPVGQCKILAPGGAENLAGRLCFLYALVWRAVARHFAPRQIAQPDRVSERGVLGERAAQADFQIIGMGTERQQIESAHSRIRVNENGSSPLSGVP